MTGPRRPPPGVEEGRPPEPVALEWLIRAETGGRLAFRGYGEIPATPPRRGRSEVPGHPAYVEIRTGPARFGLEVTDPAELRRIGWRFLSCCMRLAGALEPVPDLDSAEPEPAPEPAPEPEPCGPVVVQTTVFTHLTAAGVPLDAGPSYRPPDALSDQEASPCA